MSDMDNLVIDNMKLVYHIISRKYPTFSKDEDLIQCGMVGLVKAANTYLNDKDSVFSTYACKCIQNEIRQELRKRKVHDVPCVSLDKTVKDTDGESCSYMDLLVGDDDIAFIDIDSFVDTLTEREKNVFSLYQDGFSHDEISKELNISYTNVTTIIRNIKQKWRIFNE